MNQFTTYIPLKPVSYNESHCVVRGRLQSTYALNKFKSLVRKHLYKTWENLKVFASECSGSSKLSARYIFWIPDERLTTKNGNISRISGDVDNLCKGLQDALFVQLSKVNSSLNDAQVMSLIAEKRISPNGKYGTTILITEIDNGRK